MPQSAWMTDVERPRFPALDRDLTVDVAVIGGGITGVTTAFLLKQAGLSVALLERYRCGDSETGHTTAHLTIVTDKRIHEIAAQFGEDVAHAVLDAGGAAIDEIERNVKEQEIACDFARVPGYLHAPWDDEENREHSRLRRDHELAERFGCSTTLLETVPLANRFGVRFPNQALFHPLKYLAELTRRAAGGGCRIFEDTNVDSVDQGSTLHCSGGRVTCRYLVLATHVPLQGKTSLLPALGLQTRLAAYSSYVVGARLRDPIASPGLWWDTSDPYYYLRLESRGDAHTAVFGGEDHKTGQLDDTSKPFHALAERLKRIAPGAAINYRWSGQVVETNDGLPLIGETSERQFVATGFAGNGMTFGTLSGLMIRDAVIGRSNPWKDVFEPSRIQLRGGTWRYLTENSDYPRYYAQDRLMPADVDSLADVPAGSGRIVTLSGEKVAAYRDPHGNLTCVSPICTHMGCIVHWNRAERTWDCPCHGARYSPDGKVIAGPAESPLAPHQEHAAQ